MEADGGVIRLAGSDDSGSGARWRVFISHTSELRNFPKGMSYVAAVERAITAAGLVVVDMADFAAADQPAARVCTERVLGCEVYLGLLGTSYGSPVKDRPEVSYTELEFESATKAGLDRLVFLLDTGAEDVGIPPSALIDRETGDRQDAFRRRVQDSGLTTQDFAHPAVLGQLVERSLRELADTRQRIDNGIRREQAPAESVPVRAAKFINPPPAVAPTWFQGRGTETSLLARYVLDPGIAMVTVVGRGGIGKTAMVCRLLKGFEAGHIPDANADPAAIDVGGIVYLSRNGLHRADYSTLVTDLLRLLPADVGQQLRDKYQDTNHSPTEVMLALLEAFPAGKPVLIFLDNLESIMDAERETLTDPALREALTAVLTAPAHAVTVITTTRVTPTELLNAEPGRQRQLRLDEGLGSPDAQTVLRELDHDGHLGLRDASDELLDGLRRHTRGFPRALEAVKAILDLDQTLTPHDVLVRASRLPESQVVQVLVGEAYELLDTPARQVMQALAVYPAPISAAGVDFLLRAVNPTIDAEPILTRLVRRQLARFQDGRYHLHPVDRDYARGRLSPGNQGDSPAAFTLAGLQAHAADYYAQIRMPHESWHALEDVRPQLTEFELRCDTGDYDTAATVLKDIDHDYLFAWGHYRTLIYLHGRIHGRITDSALNILHLNGLGNCHAYLGDYQQAIDLYSQALVIARETSDRKGESRALGNMGLCYFNLGQFRQAIDQHIQVLSIARETGDHRTERLAAANLGNSHASLGEYPQAIEWLTQALSIAREAGNREDQGFALSSLGLCHFMLGHYRPAIDLQTQALVIARETGSRWDESSALSNLGRCHACLGEYQQAAGLQSQALAISRDIGDRQGESYALSILGRCHASLGEYQQATDLLTQALAISRDIGARGNESYHLSNLGRCLASLGEYQQAIDLLTQALDISRDTGDRREEGNALAYLGQIRLASGEADEAVTLLDQALAIADTSGDSELIVHARSGLARAHLQRVDPARALAAAREQEFPCPAEEPVRELLEGLALLELHRLDESVRAFTTTASAADALLAVAHRNVVALQSRALALSGLAAATGDAARAAQASEAFAQARAVISAAGVVADTDRLLDQIRSHDRSGVLGEICAVQDP